jgi:hypothetical protein
MMDRYRAKSNQVCVIAARRYRHGHWETQWSYQIADRIYHLVRHNEFLEARGLAPSFTIRGFVVHRGLLCWMMDALIHMLSTVESKIIYCLHVLSVRRTCIGRRKERLQGLSRHFNGVKFVSVRPCRMHSQADTVTEADFAHVVQAHVQ